MYVIQFELEIRFLRDRHKIGPFAIVLGAGGLSELGIVCIIFHRHGPRRFENIGVFHGDMDKQLRPVSFNAVGPR